MSPDMQQSDLLPDTVQTRADGLRVRDRIIVQRDGENFCGLILGIKPTNDPGELSLRLRLEFECAPIGMCTQTARLETTFVRVLPYHRPADDIPATTKRGLAAAAELFGSDWDRDGTVSVHVAKGVARQILGDRGWENLRNDDGTHFAWIAPDGERFWETDDAVCAALTAECMDSPPPSGLMAAHTTSDGGEREHTIEDTSR